MISSIAADKLIAYNTGLLGRQVAENSMKIDQYILELKELEKRLCGIEAGKAIA